MNLASFSKFAKIQNKMEEEAKLTAGKKVLNGKKENGQKKEFRCEECGRVFPAKQNLGTHMRRYHKTEILVCPVPGCNKTYKHRWDLTSHTKVAHNGEKVMCPNCGSCFSKKSNLYNHLHRGKGCPKREDKEDNDVRREATVRPPTVKQEKLNFAELKDEAYGDSDEELSDLVIDDTNHPETVKLEEEDEVEEEEIDDEERMEEEVEESYVKVEEPRTLRLNRFEFLKANREMLQGGMLQNREALQDPSPPPRPPTNTTALNNLHLLADIAMAHEQYSDTSSEHDQEEVRQVATIKPRVTESPVNLSQYREIKPAMSSSSSSSSSSQGYRDIKPHIPAKVQILQSGGGLTYQMIPVQTSQPVVMALQPIQSSGGVILANTINTISNMGS